MTGKLGVISDTHKLLRPEAVSFLQGVDLIVHAGDIGEPDVIEQLETIAPVKAVRGNVDRGEWALKYPLEEVMEWNGKYLYVLHILEEMTMDPIAAGFDIVIYGHTHQPKIEEKDGIIYFNPGSAGPKRFKLPITIGAIEFGPEGPEPQFFPLLDS